jgi:hypothetical protein
MIAIGAVSAIDITREWEQGCYPCDRSSAAHRHGYE